MAFLGCLPGVLWWVRGTYHQEVFRGLALSNHPHSKRSFFLFSSIQSWEPQRMSQTGAQPPLWLLPFSLSQQGEWTRGPEVLIAAVPQQNIIIFIDFHGIPFFDCFLFVASFIFKCIYFHLKAEIIWRKIWSKQCGPGDMRVGYDSCRGSLDDLSLANIELTCEWLIAGLSLRTSSQGRWENYGQMGARMLSIDSGENSISFMHFLGVDPFCRLSAEVREEEGHKPGQGVDWRGDGGRQTAGFAVLWETDWIGRGWHSPEGDKVFRSRYPWFYSVWDAFPNFWRVILCFISGEYPFSTLSPCGAHITQLRQAHIF